MTYDLSRFSTQSFERFSQTLAAKQFGSATQVYGAGADGAREATYNGWFNPMPDGERYEGYLVVQAKYRKSPQSPPNDLAWLKKQVDAEFRKFSSPKRQLRTPEYYVLATNIALTPGAPDAAGKRGGTLDEMISHMEMWKTILNVKEIFIWHADVLKTFLDLHAELRTTFSSWVVPGDVLSAALDHFKAPDFATVLKRVVRDELKDQRGIKTQDAAQAHGQINIDNVFVDVPLTPWSLFDLSDLAFVDDELDEESGPADFEDIDDEQEDLDGSDGNFVRFNVVNQVMEKLSDKLAPLVTSKEGNQRSSYHRIVVLGGPGQGKSTIGQFLAQLLRARLVLAGGNVPPEIAAVARATIKRASDESIDLSGPLRFPIHIALPRYADEISKAGDSAPSLLRYAATYFSKISDEQVDPKLLRDWIQHYPCLILLDGLDEVPRTSNRADVIRAIERLVSDIHEAGADALILVTSRPQGYTEDLDRQHWAHWTLANLDRENAVRFATRLGEVVISEPRRRTEVLTILAQAGEDESTAPLMISPLQISLLLSLVVTRNDIPKDRWTLFERHYEMLRDREIAKGGYNGELIRRYRSEIDRIHYDAGFLLQVRAEKEGNASAHFTIGEFKRLIVRNLADSLVESETVERVANRIVEIATNRLVFLSDRNEGKIAFDVRSLQEFMAAARIMASPEERIRERLMEIALKSHWAHVFRIAASKVYAQANLQDFRDVILQILDNLDHGDAGTGYRAVRAGGRLAISLLTDSTAGARQTDKVKLMARAVRIFETSSVDNIEGLTKVADFVTLSTLNIAVDENLMNQGGPILLNTLRFLVTLSRKADHPLVDWAAEKLDGIGIADKDKTSLLDIPFPLDAPAKTLGRLFQFLWAAEPMDARRWLRGSKVDLQGFEGSFIERLSTETHRLPVYHNGVEVEGFDVRYKPLASLQGLTFNVGNSTSTSRGWRIVAAAISFSENPSCERLAAAVESAGNPYKDSALLVEMPWPIGSCLTAINKGFAEPVTLAQQIRRGDHGHPDDWSKAEARWNIAGVELVNAPHPSYEGFNLSSMMGEGPPSRRLHKTSSAGKALSLLLQTEWPTDKQLLIMQLMCYLVGTQEEAVSLAKWIGDDLLAKDWDELTNRRVAGLIRKALATYVNAPHVTKLIEKVPGDTKPTVLNPDVPDGLLEMLQQQDRAWAALALYADLPYRDKVKQKLVKMHARTFETPTTANNKLSRALVVLRTLADKSKPDEIVADIEALMGVSEDQPFSSVLRKIYYGQRENAVLEDLVCRAAEYALDNNYQDRDALVGIVAQLIASKESNLDDIACLERLRLPRDVGRDAS